MRGASVPASIGPLCQHEWRRLRLGGTSPRRWSPGTGHMHDCTGAHVHVYEIVLHVLARFSRFSSIFVKEHRTALTDLDR